jgi:hypothetical protein
MFVCLVVVQVAVFVVEEGADEFVLCSSLLLFFSSDLACMSDEHLFTAHARRYYRGTNGGVTNWTARPDVFPDGIESLYRATG